MPLKDTTVCTRTSTVFVSFSPTVRPRQARGHRHLWDPVHAAVGALGRRRRRRRQTLRSRVLQGRLERLAQGHDNERMPGRHWRPHSGIQVRVPCSDLLASTITIVFFSSFSKNYPGTCSAWSLRMCTGWVSPERSPTPSTSPAPPLTG